MTVYSVDKDVCKGLPYKFRCRVHGKYDEEFLNTSPNDTTKLSSDLTDYDGLSYDIEPKYTVNATRVGSLTVTDDCIVGGFSFNNIIFTNYDFLMFANELAAGFEIRLHIKTGSSLSNQWILSNGASWNTGLGLTINNDLGNKFWFRFSNADNSINWTFNGTSSLSTNTEYWLRLIKGEGSVDTYFQLSTDGTNWTTEDSQTISFSDHFITSGAFNFGNLTTGNEYFRGQIYMADCYVNFASTRKWSGVELQQTVLDFSKTKLPWKWDYLDMLRTKRFAVATLGNIVSYYGNTLNATVTGLIMVGLARELTNISSSSYIKLPNPFMPSDKTWEIVWRMKTSTLDTQQYFYGSSTDYQRTVGGELNSSNKFCSGISSNGTSWNIGWLTGTTTWEADTWYWVKISFTGTLYKLELSTDGVNWNLEDSIESSTSIYQDSSKSYMFLGTMGNKSSYWKGRIDLKESYIKVDNKIWWRGFSKDSVQGCVVGSGSSQNFNMEGSLTIANGVVSGFSEDDFMTANSSLASMGNTYIFKFTTGNDVSEFQNVLAPNNFFELYIEDGDLNVWLESEGHEISCGSVNTNTTYWAKVVTGNGSCTLSYSTDGVTYTGAVTDSLTQGYTDYFRIGGGLEDLESRYFRGTIDMANSYILQNGSEIWRGISSGNLSGFDANGQYYCYAVNGDEKVKLQKKTGSSIDTSSTNPRYLGEVDV